MNSCTLCRQFKHDFIDPLTGHMVCNRCTKKLSGMLAHRYFGHVKSRVMERFGIEFTEDKYRSVVCEIQKDSSKFICHVDKKTSIQIVKVDGVAIPFVFRRVKKSSSFIKTALPAKFLCTTISGQRFSMLAR